MKRAALTYQRETAPEAPVRPEPMADRSMDEKPRRHGLLRSFQFAGEGFIHVVWTQRNFRLQLVATAAALGAGAYFHITTAEWAAVLTIAALVLVLEMVNTAVEAVVDMVTCDYHALAKVAKDVSAAAVLVAVLFAMAIGGVVFVPYVLRMWHGVS